MPAWRRRTAGERRWPASLAVVGAATLQLSLPHRLAMPPRFLLPWPGLSGFGLDRGLNRSYQSTLGAELTLPWDATIDGQIYFNWIPRLTEFSFGRYMTGNNGFEQTFASTYPGRAYGLELIARRRLGQRLFGWLTYTYSRAERNFPGAGWHPADFDEPHLVNAVVSYALGRSWTVSTVFHYNSGRPYTIGPAPVTSTRSPAPTFAFWQAQTPTESGSMSAPASSETESGRANAKSSWIVT